MRQVHDGRQAWSGTASPWSGRPGPHSGSPACHGCAAARGARCCAGRPKSQPVAPPARPPALRRSPAGPPARGDASAWIVRAQADAARVRRTPGLLTSRAAAHHECGTPPAARSPSAAFRSGPRRRPPRPWQQQRPAGVHQVIERRAAALAAGPVDRQTARDRRLVGGHHHSRRRRASRDQGGGQSGQAGAAEEGRYRDHRTQHRPPGLRPQGQRRIDPQTTSAEPRLGGNRNTQRALRERPPRHLGGARQMGSPVNRRLRRGD